MKLFRGVIYIINVLMLLGVVFCLGHMLFADGTSPKDILSALDLDLPKYEIVSPEDNLDRSASAWDWYYYKVSFSSQDSSALTTQLIQKGWDYEDEEYSNSKVEGFDSDIIYSAHVSPSTGTAILEVEMDEFYFIRDLVIAFLLLLVIMIIDGIYVLVRYVSTFLMRKNNSPTDHR